MSRLARHVDGLWTVAAPLSFYGLRLGTRMTVVRLPDGGLWLHSPVPLDAELRAELDALGPVRQIVAPNLFHNLWAGDVVAAYPGARLHAPAALRRKRPDLRIDRVLEDGPDPEWGGVLDALPFEGAPLVQETVFVHRPTRTLVTADVIENFHACEHAPTRAYLRVAGIWKRPGFSRLLRPVYRDRAAAQRSVERLLGLDFDRIALAHGAVLETGGREALRATYAWL